MIINHNLNALNSHRNMGINNSKSAKSMEKLSSGLRISRAGDDAAGLAISEKMRGQIRGLDQAGRNAQDGISMLQTAEGALSETHSIIQRMRELAVQASNDTNTTIDRGEIQKEFNQLTSEITKIGNGTEFNTQHLLDGTTNTGVWSLQIGANQGQQFSVDIKDMRALTNLKLATSTTGGTKSIDVGSGAENFDYTTGSINELSDKSGLAVEFALSLDTATNATKAIKVIDYASKQVSSERAKLGAFQNRLEHTIANLGTASENLTSSESRIRDVDMAKEMMNFSKNNILSQAAQAMLAQANQMPQGVLQLLK